jgi:SAM-dependent methyltransferase
MNESAVQTNYFDEHADFLSDLYSTEATFRDRAIMFVKEGEELLRRVGRNGPRPLCWDLGCGPGLIALALADAGFRVVGVDNSRRMIERAEQARDTSGRSNPVRFVCDDLDNFVLSSVERPVMVVCSSVLEYLDRPGDAVRRVANRLRVGGRLLVSIPNRSSLFRKLEPLIQPLLPRQRRYIGEWRNDLVPADYERLARQIPLSLVRVRYFGLPRPALTVLRPLSRQRRVGTMALLVYERLSGSANDVGGPG